MHMMKLRRKNSDSEDMGESVSVNELGKSKLFKSCVFGLVKKKNTLFKDLTNWKSVMRHEKKRVEGKGNLSCQDGRSMKVNPITKTRVQYKDVVMMNRTIKVIKLHIDIKGNIQKTELKDIREEIKESRDSKSLSLILLNKLENAKEIFTDLKWKYDKHNSRFNKIN